MKKIIIVIFEIFVHSSSHHQCQLKPLGLGLVPSTLLEGRNESPPHPYHVLQCATACHGHATVSFSILKFYLPLRNVLCFSNLRRTEMVEIKSRSYARQPNPQRLCYIPTSSLCVYYSVYFDLSLDVKKFLYVLVSVYIVNNHLDE